MSTVGPRGWNERFRGIIILAVITSDKIAPLAYVADWRMTRVVRGHGLQFHGALHVNC